MYKNIVILGYKFDLLQLSLVVTTTIFFILLGNWQLDRLGQKETLITKIEQSLINSPIQLQKDTEIYSKVRITGKFLNDNIFLYGRRSATKEKDGYYLLTTFVSDQGQKFLVSRGWLGQSTKDNFIALPNKEKEEVIAIMLPGEIKRFFIPSNDIKQNIWFTLDLSMAKELYKLDNNSYYLMQITAKNLPQEIKPHTGMYLSKIRNDHLEYAITWYSLAIAVLLMYIIYNYKLNLKYT
ncbi:MAG: hypothetical protein HRU35_03660 [Rickettsiaceae bacterium]|nr:hypothetical protein [Rickettsiaceae bacterium]